MAMYLCINERVDAAVEMGQCEGEILQRLHKFDHLPISIWLEGSVIRNYESHNHTRARQYEENNCNNSEYLRYTKILTFSTHFCALVFSRDDPFLQKAIREDPHDHSEA